MNEQNFHPVLAMQAQTSTPRHHAYVAYKDRLTILDRIDNLERFALPSLRERYQRHALLVQLGRGNPRKADAIAQELQAAESDLVGLKNRLLAMES